MARIGMILDRLMDFIDGLQERRVSTYAACAAFYLFLSFVPLIMLLVSVLPYTPFTSEIVLSHLEGLVPEHVRQLVQVVLTDLFAQNATVIPFSVLTALWSASRVSVVIMRGLDEIHGIPEHARPNGLRVRLRAALFTLILLIVMVAAFSLLVLSERHWAETGASDQWLQWRVPIAIALLFGWVTLIYLWMPNGQPRHIRDQWPGAAAASLACVGFSWGFYTGLQHVNAFTAYGRLAVTIVSLLWMYYICDFLFIGAYWNDCRQARYPTTRMSADNTFSKNDNSSGENCRCNSPTASIIN